MKRRIRHGKIKVFFPASPPPAASLCLGGAALGSPAYNHPIPSKGTAPQPPAVNRKPGPAFPYSGASGRLLAHGIPIRR